MGGSEQIHPIAPVSYVRWLDPLYNDIEAQKIAEASQHFRGKGHRYRLEIWRLQLRTNWLDIAFSLVAISTVISGVLLYAFSWPWSTIDKGIGHGGVVLACANVMTFGVVVLAAISTPIQRAADLGPGLTTAILRKPAPWIGGFLVAPVLVFFFWLSMQRPDSEAAMASAMLAAGIFTYWWSQSRRSIALLDSLMLSELLSKQARQTFRSIAKAGERLANLSLKPSVPGESREAFVNSQRSMLATGALRQMQLAITWSVRNGRGAEAFALWETAIEEVVEFGSKYNGTFGLKSGMIDMIVETLPIVCHGLDSSEHRITARKSVELAGVLLANPQLTLEAGKTRSQLRTAFRGLVNGYWSDDYSEVPVSATLRLGDSAAGLIKIGAFDDFTETVLIIGELLSRSHQTQRSHIEQAAAEALVTCFESALMHGREDQRYSYLRIWLLLTKSEILKITNSNAVAVFEPRRQLIPGLDHNQTGLQAVLLQIQTIGQFNDAGRIMCKFVNFLLPQLLYIKQDQSLDGGPPAASLDLLLCLLLTGIHIRPVGAGDQLMGQRVIDTVLKCLSETLPEIRAGVLTDESFVEQLWSIVIAAGALDNSLDLVRQAALKIKPWLELEGVARDEFQWRFVVGVLIAAGDSSNEIDKVMEKLSTLDPFSDLSSDFQIPPLGSANSCNRNRTLHFEGAVDFTNSWALTNFPDFGEGESSKYES